MTRTTLFKSNRSQAVRLPKAVAFPDHVREVEIIRDGNKIVIMPADSSWEEFFKMLPSPDFPEREQPETQDREPLD